MEVGGGGAMEARCLCTSPADLLVHRLHAHPTRPSLSSYSLSSAASLSVCPPAQANSAILNALLTLLNERLFDNGSERITVPLTCLVSASSAPCCALLGGCGGQCALAVPSHLLPCRPC